MVSGLARLVTVAAFLVIAACAEGPTEISTPLNLEAAGLGNLSSDEAQLLQEYKTGQPFSEGLLRRVILAQHLAKFKEFDPGHPMSLADLDARIAAWGATEAETRRLKPSYEIRMPNIPYDKYAVTLGHVVTQEALQCYSGTLFHFVQADAMKAIARKNRVAIFESGHVLPGYMAYENGQWVLYGIESTALGEAITEYGPFRDISRKIRVVDARMFLMVDVFKFKLQKNQDLVNQALALTTDFYGGKDYMVQEQEPVIGNEMNYSPFAFGESNPPAGRQERPKFDRRNREDVGGVFGASLAPLRTDGQVIHIRELTRPHQETSPLLNVTDAQILNAVSTLLSRLPPEQLAKEPLPEFKDVAPLLDRDLGPLERTTINSVGSLTHIMNQGFLKQEQALSPETRKRLIEMTRAYFPESPLTALIQGKLPPGEKDQKPKRVIGLPGGFRGGSYNIEVLKKENGLVAAVWNKTGLNLVDLETGASKLVTHLPIPEGHQLSTQWLVQNPGHSFVGYTVQASPSGSFSLIVGVDSGEFTALPGKLVTQIADNGNLLALSEDRKTAAVLTKDGRIVHQAECGDYPELIGTGSSLVCQRGQGITLTNLETGQVAKPSVGPGFYWGGGLFGLLSGEILDLLTGQKKSLGLKDGEHLVHRDRKSRIAVLGNKHQMRAVSIDTGEVIQSVSIEDGAFQSASSDGREMVLSNPQRQNYFYSVQGAPESRPLGKPGQRVTLTGDFYDISEAGGGLAYGIEGAHVLGSSLLNSFVHKQFGQTYFGSRLWQFPQNEFVILSYDGSKLMIFDWVK